MFISCNYNGKQIVVDTATKTWRYLGIANEEIEGEVLMQILSGKLKKAEPTQAEIGEVTRLAYR